MPFPFPYDRKLRQKKRKSVESQQKSLSIFILFVWLVYFNAGHKKTVSQIEKIGKFQDLQFLVQFTNRIFFFLTNSSQVSVLKFLYFVLTGYI